MRCSLLKTQRQSHRAFTLIEVIVVTCIIGLLAVLILPAIQSARDKARRASCTNNLRNIGIALHNYVSASGVFPQGTNGRGYSLHAMILPYLDERALFNSMNFVYSQPRRGMKFPYPPNLTAAATALTVFLCPSDSGGGMVNYAGNQGYGFGRYGCDDNGAFVLPDSSPIGPANFSDGTSQTVAMSEWVSGSPPGGRRDPKQAIFVTPREYLQSGQFEAFASECRGIDVLGAILSPSIKGASWIHGDLTETLYNHDLGISGNSCINGTLLQHGAYSAGSRHGDGAGVIFADGHVDFLKQTTSLAVWRAMGSRGGSEIIGASAD